MYDTGLQRLHQTKSSLRLKTNSRKLSLTKEQQTILALFKEKIPDLSWEPETIHNEIYKISEETKIPIKTAFSAIYQILLGQEKGPRAGFFLSNLEKQFVLDRVTEAVK